jgi:NMD protein affecting ribosome stability and mRNA decay
MKERRSRRRKIRGNPYLRERIHDPLHPTGKLRESTRCRRCGVQYRAGRWRWPTSTSQGLKPVTCPACRRIEGHYPAGELVLAGRFLSGHRDEILATAKHVEARESADHPLNRVMSIEQRDGETVISTTDIHLPHRIAHALLDAWGGTTRTHYDLEGYFTRIRWSRDV